MNFTKSDLNTTVNVNPEYLEKNRKWYKIDATGKTLGKLAVIISNILTGKNKPYANHFWDAGDFVVVTNVNKIRVSGNKLQEKIYYTHSGYKGNLKSITLESLLQKNPSRAMYYAVKGMIAKNKLRDRRLKRLKLFAEDTSKYDYLNPEIIN